MICTRNRNPRQRRCCQLAGSWDPTLSDLAFALTTKREIIGEVIADDATKRHAALSIRAVDDSSGQNRLGADNSSQNCSVVEATASVRQSINPEFLYSVG